MYEQTQISQLKEPKFYLGSFKPIGVLPYNSKGKQTIAYLGNPIVAPRGPGITRRAS